MSEDTYLEWIARAEPKAGDLILAREAPVGEVGIVPPGQRVCQGQRTVLLRPDPRQVVPRYLLYLLLTPGMRRLMLANAEGSTTPHLNVADVKRLEIPELPPLEEQRQVADLLGALDDKIEMNRRMNETLEAMARAIFKSWFVDFDPVRAKVNGDEPNSTNALTASLFPGSFEDSPQGPIPTGWRFSRINDLVEVVDCLHSKKPERQSEGFPLLQLWNIRDDGLIDMANPYLVSEGDYRLWTRRIEAAPGDCVVTNVGRSGAAARIPAGLRAALGRNMTALRCKSDSPFPTFLIQVLLSPAMAEEIDRKLDAGTIMSALNVRSIPLLEFLRPPAGLLEAFEQRCPPLRALMEHNLEESRVLAQTRDALLPRLMSGYLHVAG